MRMSPIDSDWTVNKTATPTSEGPGTETNT